MVTFCIIRHGETEPNRRNACLGRTDVPLNQRGMDQAFRLFSRIMLLHCDAVYSSPLSRAKDTVSVYLKARKDLSLQEDERLIERDFGEWENMTIPDIEATDQERFALWMEDFVGFPAPGGESSADVQKRVDSLIDELAEKHDGEKVMLSTHLGTARHIISKCLGLTLEESWRFTLDNAGFAVIEYDREKGYGVLKRLDS